MGVGLQQAVIVVLPEAQAGDDSLLQGRGGAYCQTVPRAAEEAAEQRGDVHGAKGAADLGDLSRQERKDEGQGQEQGRQDQPAQGLLLG